MQFGFKKWLDGTPSTENYTTDSTFKTWVNGFPFTGDASSIPIDYQSSVISAVNCNAHAGSYLLIDPPAIIYQSVTMESINENAHAGTYKLETYVASVFGFKKWLDGTPSTENYTPDQTYKTWVNGSLFIGDVPVFVEGITYQSLPADAVNGNLHAPTYALADPPIPSRIKYWDGANWVTKNLKYWNGSAWVIRSVRYYADGTWQ